jgi:hypothetical protein
MGQCLAFDFFKIFQIRVIGCSGGRSAGGIRNGRAAVQGDRTVRGAAGRGGRGSGVGRVAANAWLLGTTGTA